MNDLHDLPMLRAAFLAASSAILGLLSELPIIITSSCSGLSFSIRIFRIAGSFLNESWWVLVGITSFLALKNKVVAPTEYEFESLV